MLAIRPLPEGALLAGFTREVDACRHIRQICALKSVVQCQRSSSQKLPKYHLWPQGRFVSCAAFAGKVE